jgi:hypothetical protein
MKKSLLLFVLFAVCAVQNNSYAQGLPVCGGQFLDNGGITANYAPNSNYTITICPNNPTDVVRVAFTSFSTETNWDGLYVYNGNSIASPQIPSANAVGFGPLATLAGSFSGSLTGNNLPTFTSTDASGCLTFVFKSDASMNMAGWTANITCGPASTSACLVPTNVLSSNFQNQSATISWTENSNATQWEVLVLPAGTAPTTTSVGTISTVNPTVISNLNSAVNVVYIRSICSATDVSNWSSPVTLTTPVCVSPTQLSATGITQTSANLTWANTSNATSWQVAVQLSTITTLPTTGTTTSINTNYLTSGLLPGTAYKYYVRTDCGNGLYSGWITASFTTLAPLLVAPVCGGTFIDNGGLTANYFNNTDSTITVYPTNAGDVVTVQFTAFDTETSWDGLYVYNGNSVNAPQIASGNPAGNVPGGLAGAFWGTTIPGPFTSTSADGSLTFRFISDSAVNKPGWSANVVCGPAPTCIAPIAIEVQPNYNTATITWNSGTTTQWEVLVLPATVALPTATSVGTIVNTNTFNATGLIAGTAYKVYVRAICSATDISFWAIQSFTTLLCSTPSTTVTSITSNTALLNFVINNTNVLSWEYLVLPSSTAPPSATTTGISTNTTINSITGLLCGTSYTVYLKTFCSNNQTSPWVLKNTFTTLVCSLTTGQPVNLTQCFDTVFPCFDLTTNTPLILGTLNPTEYSVSYYDSQLSAANQTANLGGNYCAFEYSRTMYAVIKNLATGQMQTFTFLVISKNMNNAQVLPAITQCDSNSNGSEVFDLSNLVSSTNALNYYTTLANATNQTAPLTAINAYTVFTTTNAPIIYIRETIANNCDNLYQIQLNLYADCNLAHNCAAANSLCGALGVPFTNTHQAISAEPGNNYGCLGSTPNPTWFYMQISNPGTLNLTIEQNTSIAFTGGVGLDVDYIVYGPFTNAVTPCSGSLTTANTVSCSFSASPIEHPVINTLAGQYYLIMTTNYSNQAGFIRITADSSSTAAINCSGIRMNAFLDINNNGTQEVGEQNFPLGQFQYIKNSGLTHNITSPTGVYTIYENSTLNNYDLGYTVDPLYNSMYSVSVASYSGISIGTSAGLLTYNFPITTLVNYTDLAVTVIPITAPRAGFNYKNKIAYANLGNQTIASGSLSFVKNAASTIVSTSEVVTSNAGGFTYNFSNLLPFEYRFIDVTMSVPSIPNVAIGQLLTNTANVTTPDTETTLSNNNSNLTQVVIAAYDPNDKTESHGERILYTNFAADDYLTYTIRFENTGNASAVSVTVTDELDAKIDETSIKMVNASHNYVLDRVGKNLNWKFNNIQLPVSVANTETGKGFITFKAKLKTGFNVGTVVPNFANIYFDTNPAITTNTFNTEFVATLANENFTVNNFDVAPNPASGVVNVNLKNTTENIESISVTDVLGKLVKRIAAVSSQQTQFDVSDLEKGVYMVEIVTTSNLKQTKKLIVR